MPEKFKLHDRVRWTDGALGTVVLEPMPQWNRGNTEPMLHIRWDDNQRTCLEDFVAMEQVSKVKSNA